MNQDNYIQLSQKLHSIHGYCGLGWGLKEINNRLTNVISWRIYVRNKVSLKQLPFSSRLPGSYFGIPTDIIEKPLTVAAIRNSSIQSSSGCLIANDKGTPGTLGCFAFSHTKNEDVFLTNFHVLFSNGACEFDTIWIGGNTKNTVFKELGKALYGRIGTVKYRENKYYVDCAIGSISNLGKKAKKQILTGTKISGIGDPRVGIRVSKMGFSSGLTKGIIIDANYPDEAIINGKTYHAPNQLLIKPVASDESSSNSMRFSTQGDSGSVIVDEQKKAVGLLWGTNSKGEGVACHMRPVTRELNISI